MLVSAAKLVEKGKCVLFTSQSSVPMHSPSAERMDRLLEMARVLKWQRRVLTRHFAQWMALIVSNFGLILPNWCPSKRSVERIQAIKEERLIWLLFIGRVETRKTRRDVALKEQARAQISRPKVAFKESSIGDPQRMDWQKNAIWGWRPHWNRATYGIATRWHLGYPNMRDLFLSKFRSRRKDRRTNKDK